MRMAMQRLPVFLGALIILFCNRFALAETIPIVVDAPVTPPVQLALDDLQQALKTKGFKPVRRQSLQNDAPSTIVAGIAKLSPIADRLLAAHRVALAEQEESLCI